MKKAQVQLLTYLFIILFIGNNQEANAKTWNQSILVAVKNKPLEVVLSMIEKQTGYVFIYSYTQLEKVPLVSLIAEDASIEKILNKLFKDRYITYTISQKYIVLKKAKEIMPKEPSTKKKISSNS